MYLLWMDIIIIESCRTPVYLRKNNEVDDRGWLLVGIIPFQVKYLLFV